MAGFSNVDASGSVASLVSYLRAADAGLAAMKSYIAVAAARALANGLVLDVGCGLGGDVSRLRGLGLDAVGLDASGELLARARDVLPDAPLVRGDGAALPFRDAGFDGCRIERVLQHVADPARVLTEVARVVRGGGFVAVFEPDYSTFRVTSDVVPDGSLPARAMRVRHPTIGAAVGPLLERVGFRVDDIVTESSRGYGLGELPVDVEGVLRRGIGDGRVDRRTVDDWLAEQRARTAAGTFASRYDKILVVATRR